MVEAEAETEEQEEQADTAAKFSAGRTMVIGNALTAARGIWSAMAIEEDSDIYWDILKRGVHEIKREFKGGEYCDAKDKARFAYIYGQAASLLKQENGVSRDAGHEGMTLDDFVKHPVAVAAGLKKAHVLALRLYTSNSYDRINGPLRGGCSSGNPHPYAATVYYIHSGIMKLRATRAAAHATAHRTFWRGLTDMSVAEEFLKQGGTEMACMSTTEYLAVARKFAKVGKVANPLLIKVESNSLMNCGADISWLSMYPEEAEVLFPPLTFLRPMGKPVVEDGCTVIVVQPYFG
jgi:hypothetical protein